MPQRIPEANKMTESPESSRKEMMTKQNMLAKLTSVSNTGKRKTITWRGVLPDLKQVKHLWGIF